MFWGDVVNISFVGQSDFLFASIPTPRPPLDATQLLSCGEEGYIVAPDHWPFSRIWAYQERRARLYLDAV